MSLLDLSLVEIEDGSLSCLDVQTGELYHNRAGAYTEAWLNYVNPSGAIERLKQQGQLNLLDVCFGLGYNTWVLLAEALAQVSTPFEIKVVALENDRRILSVLDKVLDDRRFVQLSALRPMLLGLGEELLVQNLGKARILFDLRLVDFRQQLLELDPEYDLVFHDPFSAKHVPELWTVDIFQQYRRLLNQDHGKVLTYSSARAVRGGFIEAGFRLYRTQAVGGKSGGTMACVAEDTGSRAFTLTPEELTLGKAGVPYRDQTFSADPKSIWRRRALEQAAYK